MNRRAWAEAALLPTGWARGVLLQWDEEGLLSRVETNQQAPGDAVILSGPAIPGMPNLHSHAFQRAFAGLTEYRRKGNDSFWSWRDLMYRFALRLNPEQLEAIATWLYVEMLEAGYTSVCEFHYLHHKENGRPYADTATLSKALLRAAHRVGIGMTLLPVLYQHSNFGAQPPQEDQRRFIRQTDDMLALIQGLLPVCQEQGAQLGLAPHSLRAVSPASLGEAVAGMNEINPGAPLHIHIAEQRKEVDDCLAWSGLRPVEWLLANMPIDGRWCLVHATHMTSGEAHAAAKTGAVAGLCPTTEANLGDGIFDMQSWREVEGRWGIGSDSHAAVNAAEELMLLEYSQRLATTQRNVIADANEPYVANAMMLAAVKGGSQASGRRIAGLQAGQHADFVVLDSQHVTLAALSPSDMLSAHVFASQRTSAILQVWQRGICRVENGLHRLHQEAAAAFISARNTLLEI